ncbi:MAG: biopolymer transporter ExbD [Phycisphaerales bacterium]|nr:biopolymer transporter ExbD [Phycisphaerales bacterium]
MAEMNTSSGGHHKKGPGVKKGKKQSTRVDLTPMVDLGFLLITFFIFTTTMSQPTAFKLFLPKDAQKPEEQNKVKASGTLTILIGKDGELFYYEGELSQKGDNFKTTTFNGPDNIRDEIVHKKQEVVDHHVHNQECAKIWQQNNGDKNSCLDRDFVVIIKPTKDASYENIVKVLNEMQIDVVKRYALVDIAPIEEQLIKKTEATSVAK